MRKKKSKNRTIDKRGYQTVVQPDPQQLPPSPPFQPSPPSQQHDDTCSTNKTDRLSIHQDDDKIETKINTYYFVNPNRFDTSQSPTRNKKKGSAREIALQDLLEYLQNIHKEYNLPVSDLDDWINHHKQPKINPDCRMTDARRYKRTGQILDRFVDELGFTMEQLIRAVRAIGLMAKEEQFLDWLCLNEEELPRLFTDNDGIMTYKELTGGNKNNGNGAIEVLSTSKQFLDPFSTTIDEKLMPASMEANSMVTAAKMILEQDQTLPEVDTDADTAHKAWLLSQYEYDVEYQDEYGNSNDEDGFEKRNHAENLSQIETTVMGTPSCEEAEDDWIHEKLQLEKLRRELSEAEQDMNNDANNYMRSKVENKDLQKRVRILKQQVVKLERKLGRQQQECATRQMEQSSISKEELLLVTPQIEEEDEECLFSLFDDSAEDALETLPQAQSLISPEYSNTDIDIPDIPTNWTGKTPSEILEEWCRKKDFSKPIYSKLVQNGCQIRIRQGNHDKIQLKLKRSTKNYNNAQNYVAVQALFDIDPSLQLYQLFPPFYRELWSSWLKDKQKEKEEIKSLLVEERRCKIEQFIRFACADINVKTSIDTGIAATLNNNNNNGSDCMTSNSTTPAHIFKENDNLDSSLISDGCLINELKVEYRLQQRFQLRIQTVDYRKMATQRAKLPIYTFRENILETIRNNPVTILCAETGTKKMLFFVVCVSSCY